mmetsp:Transcript_42263/g.137158  ORF Transcript_42263/g.137158 Transcript_42263/m.137158 type:complete len:460 (-) Transcript_42263:475-1854(-)
MVSPAAVIAAAAVLSASRGPAPRDQLLDTRLDEGRRVPSHVEPLAELGSLARGRPPQLPLQHRTPQALLHKREPLNVGRAAQCRLLVGPAAELRPHDVRFSGTFIGKAKARCTVERACASPKAADGTAPCDPPAEQHRRARAVQRGDARQPHAHGGDAQHQRHACQRRDERGDQDGHPHVHVLNVLKLVRMWALDIAPIAVVFVARGCEDSGVPADAERVLVHAGLEVERRAASAAVAVGSAALAVIAPRHLRLIFRAPLATQAAGPAGNAELPPIRAVKHAQPEDGTVEVDRAGDRVGVAASAPAGDGRRHSAEAAGATLGVALAGREAGLVHQLRVCTVALHPLRVRVRLARPIRHVARAAAAVDGHRADVANVYVVDHKLLERRRRHDAHAARVDRDCALAGAAQASSRWRIVHPSAHARLRDASAKHVAVDAENLGLACVSGVLAQGDRLAAGAR